MRYDHLTLLPERAFKVIANRMTLEGGKSDAPSAPDYTAAAQATAKGNLEAARVAAAANRINQYTPQGNLVYSHNNTPTLDTEAYNAALAAYQRTGKGVMPNQANYMTKVDPDSWSATQTLSPVEQQKLDKNNNLSLGLLDTAQLGLGGVHDALSKGFDWSSLPAQQINAGQTAQDAIMSRLNPQFTRDEDALRTRLTNQGVRPGSQAWDNEFTNFNQGKNDASIQAGLQGIDVGQKARQQAIQEQEFGRTEGLNMVNALRTGNQVQSPNFINAPQQQTTAGADLLGAAQSQYNGQLGATNAANANSANTTNGLMSLAGTAAPYFL